MSLKVFSVEYASSTGPAEMEELGYGGGAKGFLFSSYKQAVEFPQVVAS